MVLQIATRLLLRRQGFNVRSFPLYQVFFSIKSKHIEKFDTSNEPAYIILEFRKAFLTFPMDCFCHNHHCWDGSLTLRYSLIPCSCTQAKGCSCTCRSLFLRWILEAGRPQSDWFGDKNPYPLSHCEKCLQKTNIYTVDKYNDFYDRLTVATPHFLTYFLC